MADKGWEPNQLESVDRFASICMEYANDNDGFLLALGDEYHVRSNMGAVSAFRGILTTIADQVIQECRDRGYIAIVDVDGEAGAGSE